MGCFSWVNTELNWLFRAFALSRSLIIGWSFTRSVMESFWISFQAVSNVVVNIVFVGFW